MIPYVNEHGLRDYRVPIAGELVPWPRWPWLLALVAFLLGFLMGGKR